MGGAQERPLRADAARNRARLLDTATEVFTTRGVGVPTEEIARAAGVAVAALGDHRPTAPFAAPARPKARHPAWGASAASIMRRATTVSSARSGAGRERARAPARRS
ncbi:TetR family transcriptional regulator [Streptomyces sp. NPDC085524]|uniref:TetR family transcriptional regulator n=1 Tax=Streptomyces sp. NPDC085524 TaxID=3365728 RepID=UPI0037D21979